MTTRTVRSRARCPPPGSGSRRPAIRMEATCQHGHAIPVMMTAAFAFGDSITVGPEPNRVALDVYAIARLKKCELPQRDDLSGIRTR